MLMEEFNYALRRIRKGCSKYPSIWHARVEGYRVVGVGKTPDEAILDWQRQDRELTKAKTVKKVAKAAEMGE